MSYCPSRSSKVIDFGTNRKRVYIFLLVINSNLDISCTVLDIRRPKSQKSTFFPTPLLFGLKFRGVPFDRQTDRRTDRWTTYHGNTALRYASRGKNYKRHWFHLASEEDIKLHILIQEIQQGWQTSAVYALSPFTIYVRHLLPTSEVDILCIYIVNRSWIVDDCRRLTTFAAIRSCKLGPWTSRTVAHNGLRTRRRASRHGTVAPCMTYFPDTNEQRVWELWIQCSSVWRSVFR